MSVSPTLIQIYCTVLYARLSVRLCWLCLRHNVPFSSLPPPPALQPPASKAGQAEPGFRQAGQYGIKPGSQPSTADQVQQQGRQSGQYGIAAMQRAAPAGEVGCSQASTALRPSSRACSAAYGHMDLAVLFREAVSLVPPGCSGVLVQMFPLGLLLYRSCGSFFPHPALLHGRGRVGRVHCASSTV